MIRRGELFEHYRTVLAAECDALDSQQEMMVRAVGIPRMGALLASRSGLANNVSEIRPLPSSRLLIGAFGALNGTDLTRNEKDAVAAFSNTYLLPLAGLRVEPVDATHQLASTSYASETCPQSEPTFADALRQIDDLSEGKKTPSFSPFRVFHKRLSVYSASDGTPLILRKQLNISLGLTLEHIMLDDAAIIPAGTIVATQPGTNGIRQQDGWRYKAPQKDNGEGYRLSTFDIDDTFGIRPMRVSPWAYANALDRALFGVTHDIHDRWHYDLPRVHAVTKYSLDDFRQGAAQILELCAKQKTDQA